MKTRGRTPENQLFYSQTQQNPVQQKSTFSSGVSRPKLIAKKSQLISQNLAQFSLKDIKSKAKNLIVDYLKRELKVQVLALDMASLVQAISTAQNINEIFEVVFGIVGKSFRWAASKPELKQPASPVIRERELTFAIRSKQAKLLRLIQEDQTALERAPRGKSSRKVEQCQRKIEQCQRVNEELKKELYAVKQQKQSLQKKIASLVQEFQNRKTLYLAQIKKLTEIIKLSSVDVRNLVLQKTKEAKRLQQKHHPTKNHPSAAQPVQSQFSIPQNHHSRNDYSPKIHEKNSHANFNGYNTQIRIMKKVSSIQNYQEEKADSYITF